MELSKFSIFVIISFILATSVFAQAENPLLLQAKKKDAILTEWEKDVPDMLTKAKLKSELLVLWEEDAKDPEISVKDVQDKINKINKNLGLKPAGQKGFSWTYPVLILLAALIIFFAVKYRKKLSELRGKIPVEKLEAIISALRIKEKSINELQAMLSANLVEAEENMVVAQKLMEQKEDETIINLREKGEIEAKEQELNNHVKKLGSWLGKAKDIQKSILKIGKSATKNLAVAEDIENEKEKILKEYEKGQFSSEVNQEIDRLKEDIKHQRGAIDEDKKNLLLLVKLTTDINFSLSDYKKFTIKNQIDNINKEKDAIKVLVKNIKKGNKEKVMNAIDDINTAAKEIRDNLIGIKDRYKKLSMQTETLLEMLEETKESDETTRKAMQLLFRKEIDAIARLIKSSLDSRKMSDKDRLPFLFRKLEEFKGDEASAWEELRAIGVNIEIAKETIRRIKELKKTNP